MELSEAIKLHDTGAITTEKFTEIVKENQKQGIFWVPSGKNQSRFGFIHHHIFSKKGQFFQNTLKHYLLNEITRINSTGLKGSDTTHLRIVVTTIHFSWKKFYDRDAFVYADPRLQALDKYLKSYITSITDENQDFYFKIIDILLGIAKEDSYYRSRLMHYLDQLRKTHPQTDIKLDLDTVELFTRKYIDAYFQNEFPRKHNFMNWIVNIILSESKNNTILIDFIHHYRNNFPDMLIAPGEIDNINRWH